MNVLRVVRSDGEEQQPRVAQQRARPARAARRARLVGRARGRPRARRVALCTAQLVGLSGRERSSGAAVSAYRSSISFHIHINISNVATVLYYVASSSSRT